MAVPELSANWLHWTWRAARLDRSVYRDARADRSATSLAVTIVAIVAFSHAIGGLLRGMAFEWSPWTGALFGLVGELAFFLGASCATYASARAFFGVHLTYGQVLRPLELASLPGVLILAASAASLLGMQFAAPLLLLLLAWRLSASAVAVHEALGGGLGRSAVAFVLGTGMGMVSVIVATRLLGAVRDAAGIAT